jgi:hypothetical protein
MRVAQRNIEFELWERRAAMTPASSGLLLAIAFLSSKARI